MNEQKPSIGRIVIYSHGADAAGKTQQSPAIIQHVEANGSVRLFVFGPEKHHIHEEVAQGDGPGQWNWPPRGPHEYEGW